MTLDDLWGMGADWSMPFYQRIAMPEVGKSYWTRRGLVRVDSLENAIRVMEHWGAQIDESERQCHSFNVIAGVINGWPDVEAAWEAFDDGVTLNMGSRIRVRCSAYYLPGEFAQQE
jgi:hypothetical protein